MEELPSSIFALFGEGPLAPHPGLSKRPEKPPYSRVLREELCCAMQDENSGLFRANRSEHVLILSFHDFVFRNVVAKCTVLHGPHG